MDYDMDDVRHALKGLKDTNSVAKYLRVQEAFEHTDVSQDRAFQRKYKGFYRVRRDQDWCDDYFRHLEDGKGKRETISFSSILSHLHQATDYIEASFASKAASTLDPSRPVWDIKLREFWNLKLSTRDKRNLEAVSRTYSILCNHMAGLLASALGQSTVRLFDEAFPVETPRIMPMKKLDLTLWKMAKSASTSAQPQAGSTA
jgi:hypothetical protein